MFSEQRFHQSHQSHQSGAHGLGIREWLAICWRRKWTFTLCLAVTLSLGAAYFVRAQRLYQVSTRLLVETQGMPLGTGPEQQEKEFLATQAEIIRSPAVVKSVAESLQWPTPLEPDASPTAALLGSLDVHPVMGTHVISVSYRSYDVPHALDAVNGVIDSYRGYLRQAEQDSSLETLRLLAQSEKELRSDLAKLEQDYRELRKASPVTGNGKNGADVQLVLVQHLGEKLSETRNRRIELENQLEATRSWQLARGDGRTVAAPVDADRVFTGVRADQAVFPRDNSPGEALQLDAAEIAAAERLVTASMLSQVSSVEGTDISMLQTQLAEAELREKELAERYGYKHADLRAVREQINTVRNHLREAIDAAPEILRRQLDAAEANERRLAELYEREQAKAKEIDVYLLEEQQVRDQIERVHLLHDSILSQLRQTELTSQAVADGRSGVKVTVLEAPVPPAAPLWPSPAILGLVCASVGLVCAGGLVAFAEYRDPTFPVQSQHSVAPGVSSAHSFDPTEFSPDAVGVTGPPVNSPR